MAIITAVHSPCRAVRRAVFLGLLLLADRGVAQFSNPITTTPALIQDGFGPAGDLLGFGGQEFCCPTSVATSLSYLGANGFTQFGPAVPTMASELNLDQVLSGLMGTDALLGTSYDGNPSVANGLALYLAAKGIGTSSYTFTEIASPTLTDLANLQQPGTVVDLEGGFYTSAGVRNGGHCVVLAGTGVNAQGQSSPNTLVIANPLPGAIAPLADTVGNHIEYLNTIPTNANTASDGAIALDPSQYPAFWGTGTFVIEQAIGLTVNTSQLTANNPTPATWSLGANQAIGLGGGSLTVLAPIQNATGKAGSMLVSNGTLELQATNTTTGSNSVTNATLRSDITSGRPFGTGSISADSGTLMLAPVAGSSAVNLTAASGAGNSFVFADGCAIALVPNGHSSLTFTLGGFTDGTSANIGRNGAATLVVAPAGGTADLGAGEKFLVAGSGGNLPALTNGIVAPYIVAQNNDAGASGDFVTYGANGFARASYTLASGTSINSVASTAVFEADIAQAVTASTTAQVYALKVDAITVGGGAASVLNVGTQTGGQAGIVLNGGTISTPTLSFGVAEGLIYASSAGGTISSSIQGTGGLTTFGPGKLTITRGTAYTGDTNINSGVLEAANTTGTVGAGSAMYVQNSGTLEITGASGRAGGTGGINVNAGGTLLMNGGSAAGVLTMNTGSYLLGSGTIVGRATLNGTIGNPATDPSNASYTGVENLTFTGASVTLASTIISWRLNALTDTASQAGIDWTLLQFTNAAATVDLGTSTAPIHLSLDLGAGVADPSSGNAFWNQSHQWLVANDPTEFSYLSWEDSFPTYSQGSFQFSYDASFENFYLDYIPTPEPSAGLLMLLALPAMVGRRRRG
jgi:autotransporter-associated beta strand protein